MNKGHILFLAFCATALFALNGCATGGGGGGSGAHAHMKHVSDGWKDTPNGLGLGPTMHSEAVIALKHANLAAKKPGDLAWLKTHIRHVRHAIDTTTEKSGPGMGYGVIKAARGVAKHIMFAAGSGDASANVKLHATHVATSAKNVVRWSNRIILLSENVLSAKAGKKKDMKGAKNWTKRILETVKQIMRGTDADGDGFITWKTGEGGIAQAKQHMMLMKKGEKMMMK